MEYKKLELGGKKLYQHNLYFSVSQFATDRANIYMSFINEDSSEITNLGSIIQFLYNNGFYDDDHPYPVNGFYYNNTNASNKIRAIALSIEYYIDRLRVTSYIPDTNTAHISSYTESDCNFVYDTVFKVN